MRMRECRRYEILLPRQFNDGTRVPSELLWQTFRELETRFGAVSAEQQTIVGSWREGEEPYHDELLRMFVDVAHSEEHEHFFSEFKEKLEGRFKQVEIRVTSHDIRVL
jgi:hypothetical protein